MGQAKINKNSRKRVAIVVSKFNDFITKSLCRACCDELKKLNVKDKNITVCWVPGAFEIPLVALKLAQKKNVDAVICLGAVIRGETKHYDLVAEGCAQGIMRVALKTGKPVIFEVLATDTVKLAEARTKAKGCNKGRDAARAAVEMIDLLSQL